MSDHDYRFLGPDKNDITYSTTSSISYRGDQYREQRDMRLLLHQHCALRHSRLTFSGLGLLPQLSGTGVPGLYREDGC